MLSVLASSQAKVDAVAFRQLNSPCYAFLGAKEAQRWCPLVGRRLGLLHFQCRGRDFKGFILDFLGPIYSSNRFLASLIGSHLWTGHRRRQWRCFLARPFFLFLKILYHSSAAHYLNPRLMQKNWVNGAQMTINLGNSALPGSQTGFLVRMVRTTRRCFHRLALHWVGFNFSCWLGSKLLVFRAQNPFSSQLTRLGTNKLAWVAGLVGLSSKVATLQ